MQITFDDFIHTGPDTLAGRYLRTFWSPVFRSQDLAPGDVVPVKIMCEKFSLYRGQDGAPHLMAPTCPHRGAPLYVGSVEGGSLRCMYHGWKYDGSGQCVEQPRQDPSLCSDVKVRSYPIHEYLGLIFAYLGEGEPPPFRRFADMEQPGVLETCDPEFWPCNYFNRLDNACDLAHVTFTHREAISRAGRPDRMGDGDLKVEETDYGIKCICENPKQITRFHMPNINLVMANVRVEGSMQDAATLAVDRLSWRVPVDDENTVSFSVDLMHVDGEEAERYKERRKRTLEVGKVASPTAMGEAILAGQLKEKDLDKSLSTATLFSVEDYLMQVGQGAVDRSKDRLGRVDIGVILMRKIWERELLAFAEGRTLKQWKAAGLRT